jgi:uncharacterized protein YkwD
MYRSAIFSIVFVALAQVSFAQASSAQKPFYARNSNEIRIFSLINRERAKTGLGELLWDDRLADLARRYSEKMAHDRVFEHIDSDGNDVVARARQSNIRGWSKIGENLFMCDPTDDFTGLSVRGWMKSPTHRENILDPVWRDTGIGIAVASDGQIYITEVFDDI